MTARFATTGLVALTLGCSSLPPPRDTVLMKVSDDELHIRLSAASVGEPIVCRRNYCEPDPSRGKGAQRCTMRVVGRGTVVGQLGHGYSVARKSKGDCAEGDLVERAP